MNKKTIYILFLVIILAAADALAQRRVKYEILPYRNQLVLGDEDTLWVMKRRDILKLIMQADDTRYYAQKAKLLSYKNKELQNKLQTKDVLLKKEKKKLKDTHLTKEEEIQKMELTIEDKNKQIKKHKLHRNLSFIGTAATILLFIIL